MKWGDRKIADHKRMLRQAENYMVEAELDCRRLRKPREIIEQMVSIEDQIKALREELEKEE